MPAFSPHSYGPLLAGLLEPERLNDLGPGEPNQAVRPALAGLSLDEAVGNRKITDRDMAQACLAGLWLYHDFLDESHGISQEIEGPTGSYWHGIIHRREPDYGNARYWFRRVGNHPAAEPLAAEARTLAQQSPPDRAAQFLLSQERWDHDRFVDLCEAVSRGRSQSELLCRRIQLRQWQLLFDYCYRHACRAS